MANQTLSTRLNVGPVNIVVPGTSSGLVSASGLTGNTTGSAISAGFVGEVVTGSFSNYTLTTSEADVTGATLSLTTGVWRIFASVVLDITAGAAATQASTGTIKITDNSNVQKGSTSGVFVKSTTSTANEISCPAVTEAIVYPTSTTTYKLRAFLTNNNGVGSGTAIGTANASLGSTFYAVRIA